jgi:nitrogen regulatory protein P-II 1
MKKIEATIRTSKFEEVQEALHAIGVDFFTYWEVKGVGKQKGFETVYRGTHYDMGSISRRMIEVVVNDNMVEAVTEAILKSARTGEIGDGKIFISNIEKAIRIRSGEAGEKAI